MHTVNPRDRHGTRPAPRRRVRVYVHVHDPVHPGFERLGDGQRVVVGHAEPRGAVGHRVVQPAAEIHRSIHVAVCDRQDDRYRPPAINAGASCIPGKIGSSSVPMPCPTANGKPVTDARRTASMQTRVVHLAQPLHVGGARRKRGIQQVLPQTEDSPIYTLTNPPPERCRQNRYQSGTASRTG